MLSDLSDSSPTPGTGSTTTTPEKPPALNVSMTAVVAGAFAAVKAAIEDDPRLTLEANPGVTLGAAVQELEDSVMCVFILQLIGDDESIDKAEAEIDKNGVLRERLEVE